MTASKTKSGRKAAAAADPRQQPRHVVREIPLDRLRLSTLYNVRATQDEPIEPLADSIAAKGLLQNLIAVDEGDDGWHGVCAGGRRLAALQLNAARGLIAADAPVACIVVAAAEARIVSLAENYARSIMNPADEARAFADLIDEGRTAAEVAATFGVTERHVRARQRLGRLAAPVMTAFARREMTIEQAQAFAVVADPARQALVFEAWSKAASWDRSASAIKRMMTETRVALGHPLARFVGRDAYEAAGGAVDEDLFSTDVYLADADLVQRLVTERLEAAADAEVAAGWKWAAVMLEQDWSVLNRLRRLHAAQVDLDEADQARWDEIEALLEAEEITDEDYDALDAEREALQAKMIAYTDAQKATAGVVLSVGRTGELVVERGLQRAEDIAPTPKPAAETTGDGDADDVEAAPVTSAVVTLGAEDAAPTRTAAEPRDPYSGALRDDMRQILKGALQLAVAEDPALAADLLHFHVVTAAGEPYGFREGLLDLRLGDETARPRLADGWRYDEETAAVPGAQVAQTWLAGPDAAARFAAFRRLDPTDKAALVAAAVAKALRAALPREDGPDDKARIGFTASLVAAAQPEVRRIWSPTSENFLARVSRAVLLETIEVTLGADEARRSMGAKKGELVAFLHGAFNEDAERRRWDDATRQRLDFWTPPPMRHDGVGGPVATATDPSATQAELAAPEDAGADADPAIAAE